LDRAHRLEAICARYDVPLGAAALRFSLREPRVTSTIVGISLLERLAETIALAEYPIPEQLWTELATVEPSGDDPETNRWK
jgi:D-threo-aldose 1-dehydrogenase